MSSCIICLMAYNLVEKVLKVNLFSLKWNIHRDKSTNYEKGSIFKSCVKGPYEKDCSRLVTYQKTSNHENQDRVKECVLKNYSRSIARQNNCQKNKRKLDRSHNLLTNTKTR